MLLISARRPHPPNRHRVDGKLARRRGHPDVGQVLEKSARFRTEARRTSATSGSPIGPPPNGEARPSDSTPRSSSALLPRTTMTGGGGAPSTSDRRSVHLSQITDPDLRGSIAVRAAKIRIGDIAFLTTVLGLDVTRCRRFATQQTAAIGIDHRRPVRPVTPGGVA